MPSYRERGRAMERLAKAAVLTELADRMRDRGSWCGETHLQKAVHFLQNLLDVPFGFSFVLYKHGPFSFDLREELASMRADGLLEIEPQPEPYGPKLVPTERGRQLRSAYPKTLARFSRSIGFVADTLGDKGATDLERLGTALLMKQRKPKRDLDTLAAQIHAFKPHVSVEDAKLALETVEQISQQAESRKAS
jgi:hypothetical protein